MLPRAQARDRKRKGAEPRRPAAHTSGSARGLKRRRRRLISTPRPTPRTPVRQVMSPKMRLSEEEHESPGRQGGVSPRTTRERSRNAGAQRAREPVTKATAVKPREDRTKLGFRASAFRSAHQEVGLRGGEPEWRSTAPLGGSCTTRNSSRTANTPRPGVTRKAQCQSPAKSFTLEPAM